MGSAKTATVAKKQQSIASFFQTQQHAEPHSSPQPIDSADASQPIRRSAVERNIYRAESDEDGDSDEATLPLAQPKKRTLAVYADASIDAQDVPNKRACSQDRESHFFSTKSANRTSSLTRQDSIGNKKSKITPRTEKYVYNGASQPDVVEASLEEDEDAEIIRSQKEELHCRFVKKLGHPDSIARIQRRNWQINEETTALDEDDEAEEDDDEAPAPSRGRKKGAKTGKLTPMELQMLEIKRKHMDTLLVIEVGYKFKFFGEDARIAAKELGIVCIPGKFRFDEHPSEAHLDRFASASIPVHRLPVHAKRLVVAGHKVGVVRQIETAALKKAGDNRNTPFIRKLTNLYTKGTYIDDTEGLDQPADGLTGGAPATGYLLCITESKSKGWGSDEKVDVGMLAVQPATGDVIYDHFEDGFMRSEVETRLLHISPCEFLIVGELSRATEKLVQHLANSTTQLSGSKIRIEREERSKTIAAQAYDHVARFYSGKMKDRNEEDGERTSNLLEKVLKLPEPVTIALSAMITHMTEYGLEHVFDLTKYFQSFSARSHMLLQGNTLTSLEIFNNQTDYGVKGSLFWALDRTQTRFGQRLLRKWVGRPLLDKDQLEKRVEAVEELANNSRSITVDKLKSLLMKIKSDLERSLIRIYYGKCSRPEVLTVLQTMQRIATEFAAIRSPADVGFRSDLINNAIAALPTIGDTTIECLDKINLQAAKSDDKYAFFREEHESDAITNHKMGIAAVEQDLDLHRAEAAQKIKKKNVTYVTVAGIEYLIEIANVDLKHVPASWAKISGTKKVSRFHTPEVVRMIRERDQHKESLAAACDEAFAGFLADIANHYQSFRDSVACLATLDCLLSLSTVAAQPGYVKPFYSSESEISITDGRHPMVEQLLIDSYVPNDTVLSNNGTRALLITGPNMGGKSSYVRSTALICIMAQIGSYVPASAARLGMLDAVFTRMGAFDNMMAGESTFMVELSETSDILKQATPRSLVILDELGRGTSTHDGVAIANAVLDYVVRDIKCLTLFITHYQTLASVANGFANHELQNVHMAFEASTDRKTGDEEITFLFQVEHGVAHRSYGLNVARLANVPKSVIDGAAHKSAEMEESSKEKSMKGLARLLGGTIALGDADTETEKGLEQLVTGIEQFGP